MAETKGQFTARLKSEGTWDEFVKLREGFKREGLSPKQAWAEARKPYELETSKSIGVIGSVDGDMGDAVFDPDLFSGKELSSVETVEWIYNNIGLDVSPEDAPSAGAYYHLLQIRNHPLLLQDFYRTVWPKILPTKSELDKHRAFEDDGREQFELLDRLEKSEYGR